MGRGVSGLGMTPREVYLMKSADLFAKAEVERDPALKADLGNMARAYHCDWPIKQNEMTRPRSSTKCRRKGEGAMNPERYPCQNAL